MFDSDNSGSISSAELNKVIEALGIQASAFEIKQLMKIMDKDCKWNTIDK
jgi:Ca2+-binding EF-hand superfamily protein